MNESQLQAQFNLADWYVDTTSNRIFSDETEVKLETKVMAVLHHLALHHNELVTREALEQAIWGDTVVGYDALTRCIAQLRKALNDSSRKPRYIETISKKGYRLIAPISEQPLPTELDSKSGMDDIVIKEAAIPNADIDQLIRDRKTTTSTWAKGFGIFFVLLLVPGIYLLLEKNQLAPGPVSSQLQSQHKLPSIVVLPFTNLHNSTEQDYFSDGVTADITTALSKLSGLLVISTSSATDIQKTTTDIKQTAASLGARYVLEGSVRRTEDRIRVNVNLIDSASDIYLWSEKYDRELRSVFDVQDDITNNIIHALSIKLTEQEKQRTAHQYTASIEAYDDFLRGQAHYIRYNQEDNRIARHYYQQAIDRDENFARAYSAMALTYVSDHRYAWVKRSNQQLDEALRLANKGKSLNLELPQAYWVLGYVHLFRREFGDAAKAASHSISLDPNYADSYLTLAICKIHGGLHKAALSLIRKAKLLNPQYPAAYSSIMGQAYFFNGQYAQAVPVLREAIVRNNNLLTAHVFLIAALSELEQTAEVEWATAELMTIKADFSVNQLDEMLAIGKASGIDAIKKHLQRAGL